MADVIIKIEGLDELRAKMSAYPSHWKSALNKAMEASLLQIWDSVPAYPRRNVTRLTGKRKYIRTGTLGRSLGVSIDGTKLGEPSIYKITQQGMDATGEFGTNLEYAPYVIGENQAQVHRMLWWTIPGNVFFKAKPKIEQVFKIMVEEIVRWLN